MQHFWTWSGRYFGFRDGEDLWTYTGRHVGHFHGDEVYDKDGRYLGEVLDDRLITDRSKSAYRQPPFSVSAPMNGVVPSADCVGSTMLAGYEDFPEPSML